MDRNHQQQNRTYNIRPPGFQQNTNGQSNIKLWGSTTRSVVGVIQIFYGIIEISAIITFIALSLKDGVFIGIFGIIEIVWGIISAMVLIITGGFGRFSRRDSCKVIAYMVLCVSSAFCGAICLVFGGITLVDIIEMEEYEEWPRNRRITGIATSSALLATFLVHALISIVGASFTCGAVCDCNTHDTNRRRHGYNYGYRTIQGQDPRNNLLTSPLLQPNAPPVNNDSQPPSYGTL